MKNFTRRVAIVLSATAVAIGLMGTAAPAHAAKGDSGASQSSRSTEWE